MTARRLLACCLALISSAHADEPKRADTAASSASFCLFELPANGNGARRFVNMGIIQYVEHNRDELRLYFGGGNFGGGYEAKFPAKTREAAQDILNAMQQRARECATPPAAVVQATSATK